MLEKPATSSAFFVPGNTLNLPFRRAEEVEIDEIPVTTITLVAGKGMDSKWPATNEVGSIVEGTVYGLAPDRWLVIGAVRSEPKMYATDHSDAWAVLLVRGKRAFDILQALCPVDMHYSSFSAVACFQSNLGGNRVLVARTRGQEMAESYDLFVPRSSARAVLETICDMAARI